MPRSSYAPRNRYLFNATISEEDTETLAWLYVQGLMAAGISEFYQLEFGKARKPPSTKTINKLFRSFGHYLFERLVETRLPPIGNMKVEFPEQYAQYLDDMARTMVEFSLSKMNYETWRDLRGGNMIFAIDDQLPAEVRQIYSARKGQSSDPRAVLGLASLRRMAKTRYQKVVPPEQIPVIMCKSLLAFLEADPLGLPEEKRSHLIAGDEAFKTEIQRVGEADGGSSYGTFATGIDISDENFANLLSLYLQSSSPDEAINAFRQIEPGGAYKFDSKFVHGLFLHFGRMIFRKLIAPNFPKEEDFRALFPEEEQSYFHQVASIIAQVALENPIGHSYNVNYQGWEVLFLHADIVAEIRREYFAGDAKAVDPQGLVGLSTFRFVCASRIETGWQQPDLLFGMHGVALDWLKKEPLSL